MKKQSVFALILSLLLLAACVPTPEQEFVVNKGDGKLDEMIGEATPLPSYDGAQSTLADTLGAPKTVQDSFTVQIYGGTMDVVLDAGADDLVVEDGEAEIWADPEFFEPIIKALGDKGITTDVAEITRRPEMTVTLTDPKVASQVLRLVDRMEELDDVQQVTANYVIDDAIADQIEE